jgi:hypothetical protein
MINTKWLAIGDRGVELVGIDQRGNLEYICEIGNNYTKKHLRTLARNFGHQ